MITLCGLLTVCESLVPTWARKAGTNGDVKCWGSEAWLFSLAPSMNPSLSASRFRAIDKDTPRVASLLLGTLSRLSHLSVACCWDSGLVYAVYDVA